MASTDNVNIDASADLVPLQSGVNAQLLSPIVVRTVGILATIAGLLGPDILIAVAANSITYSAVGNTITFSLASTMNTNIFNASTEFQKSGTKVVGARETGWTAATGTSNKGAYATYAGQICSAAYVQAEAQATDDASKANSQRIKALEDALRTHGLIN